MNRQTRLIAIVSNAWQPVGALTGFAGSLLAWGCDSRFDGVRLSGYHICREAVNWRKVVAEFRCIERLFGAVVMALRSQREVIRFDDVREMKDLSGE
jgi:hypothetical protein